MAEMILGIVCPCQRGFFYLPLKNISLLTKEGIGKTNLPGLKVALGNFPVVISPDKCCKCIKHTQKCTSESDVYLYKYIYFIFFLVNTLVLLLCFLCTSFLFPFPFPFPFFLGRGEGVVSTFFFQVFSWDT